jgi:hypothetical protein
MSSANVSGLGTACNPNMPRDTCASLALKAQCPNDFLANSLTASGWPGVFVFGSTDPSNSDSVVPATSQCNVGTGASLPSSCMAMSGVLHTGVMRALTFLGPDVLGPLGGVNTVQTSVLQLLNAKLGGGLFTQLP